MLLSPCLYLKKSRKAMDEVSFTITPADEGARLDVFTAQTLGLSRNHVQRHIEEGYIRVNLLHVPKRYIVKTGDTITCLIPQPEVYEAKPEPISLNIVYEDKDLIVINKPQGMVVHPAPGHLTGTLVNGLLYHCQDLSGVNGVLRPGIVHRLDKDTSGLLVAAKHDKAHHGLAVQLAQRTMGRIYNAVTRGVIQQNKLIIDSNIGRHPTDRKKMAPLPFGKGKEAITHITVLKRYKAHTLVEAQLETGRTHQIRVHLAHIGHPVLGDPVYGNSKGNRQILHAKGLRFIHPITEEEMQFDTDLPIYFIEALEGLEGLEGLKGDRTLNIT